MTTNPKRHIAKRLNMTKRLSTQWIKLEFPRHIALSQLALQTINSTDSHQKRPPKRNNS